MELQARVRSLFLELQEAICAGIEEQDGRGRFREDRWEHRSAGDERAGGGGTTRVLAGGGVFEKAGVSFADVTGTLSERLARSLGVRAQGFEAAGISLVLHPLSPLVPAVHFNLRFIRLPDGERAWFGGGADLTPYYLFEEDAAHFHRVWREVCERHDPGSHPRFKRACDEYFRLAHRDEARGIGGIFFDYLDEEPEKTFAFVADAGRSFPDAYLPIVRRRLGESWWDRERDWQLHRRGRYVEFNLVYDRGTLFGLETGGRTESILMSLPPLVRWTYDHAPEPGSREAALLEVLRTPRDW
jgi:coproporphyrinogen III oxidase